jgi:hypothetical protein
MKKVSSTITWECDFDPKEKPVVSADLPKGWKIFHGTTTVSYGKSTRVIHKEYIIGPTALAATDVPTLLKIKTAVLGS